MAKITLQNNRTKSPKMDRRKNSKFESRPGVDLFLERTNLMMEKILTKMDGIQSLMATHGQEIQDLRSEIRSQAFSDVGRYEEDKDGRDDDSQPSGFKRHRKDSHVQLIKKSESPPKKMHQSSKKLLESEFDSTLREEDLPFSKQITFRQPPTSPTSPNHQLPTILANPSSKIIPFDSSPSSSSQSNSFSEPKNSKKSKNSKNGKEAEEALPSKPENGALPPLIKKKVKKVKKS